MAQSTKLQAVTIEEATQVNPFDVGVPPSSETATKAQTVGAIMLEHGLRALSARAVIALGALVDLALISSVFVLWLLIIGEPTTLQLVGVGGYAAFILASILCRKR